MKNKDEQKDIPGFSGYKCNSKGEIFSTIAKGSRVDIGKPKFLDEPKKLEPRYTQYGYARVVMKEDSSGKRKDVYIHRIVATLFVENKDPINKTEVNHKNSVTCDNRAENLEWISSKENKQYAIEHGCMTRDSKGKFKSI